MLTEAQRQLGDLMSDLSEAAFFARWMADTEYRLWSALIDPSDDGRWGNITIDASSRARLWALADEAGGWIYFVSDECVSTEEFGLAFATKAEWQAMYEARPGRA